MSFAIKSNPADFGGESSFISSLLRETGVDGAENMILEESNAWVHSPLHVPLSTKGTGGNWYLWVNGNRIAR